MSKQCPKQDTGGGPCYCDNSSNTAVIDLPFEKIKPVNYDQVITQLQKERKRLSDDLEKAEDKLSTLETFNEDICDSLKLILNEVGGVDAEGEYHKGYDAAVNEIELRVIANIPGYED